MISQKIKKFENELDSKIFPDQSPENLKTLNGRFLDLTSSRVKFNNYLSNAIQEVRRQNSYAERLPEQKSPIEDYRDLVQRVKFENLSTNRRWGLLAELARHRTKYAQYGYVDMAPNANLGQIDLDLLEESLEKLMSSNFDYYFDHVFSTMKTQHISPIISVLNEAQTQDFVFNSEISILNHQVSMLGVIRETISIFDRIESMGISDEYILNNGNLCVSELFSRLQNLVDAISKNTLEGENINVNDLSEESKTYISDHFDGDYCDFQESKYNISIIEFYNLPVRLVSIRDRLRELGLGSGLIKGSDQLEDLKVILSEKLVLTVDPNSRQLFLEECNQVSETLQKVLNYTNESFLVSDLQDLLQKISQYASDLAQILQISNQNDLLIAINESVSDIEKFKEFLLSLDENSILNNLTTLKYKNLYHKYIKDRNYNTFTYFLSRIRRELRKVQGTRGLTLENFKKTRFSSIPDCLTINNTELYKIKQKIEKIIFTKIKLEDLFARLAEKFTPEWTVEQVLEISRESFFSPTTHFLESHFRDFKLRHLVEILKLSLNTNLIAVYEQVLAEESKWNIPLLLQEICNEDYQFFPNQTMGDMDDWMIRLELIANKIRKFVSLKPYYLKNDSKINNFLTLTMQAYYKVKLSEVVEKDFKDLIDLDFSISTTVDCNLMIPEDRGNNRNVLEYLLAILEDLEINKLYLKEDFGSLNDFARYLNTIRQKQNDLHKYLTFVEKKKGVEDILTVGLVNRISEKIEKSCSSDTKSECFKAYVINSIVRAIENKINWVQDNAQLLHGYKDEAENINLNQYLDLRFYENTNSFADIQRSLNQNGNKKLSTREKLHKEDLFNLITSYFSVVLATPEDVANYLPDSQDIFDCVIFDEASQVMIGEAIPSIYRGKKVVVVGDSEQMPPSKITWFATKEIEYDERVSLISV